MSSNAPSDSRRRFLAQAPALLASVTGLRAQDSRPNILFAIADDLSWRGAFPTRGNALQLSALTRIEQEGVTFTNSYCASPSCTPSRSAILTGRQMWQVEQGGLLYGTLPVKYPVFSHLLEDAGYFVGSTGKTWGPGNWQAAGQHRPPSGKEFNSRRVASPRPGIDVRDYAANFDDFLQARRAGQPFFFWYGGTEPHRVYDKGSGLRLGKRLEDVDVPPFWPDTEEIRSDLLDYCAESEWFDSHLSRMLRSLERIGELDNTLIVVTGDNGLPFPRAKTTLYDWGLHMPLALRWGARVNGGRRVDDFVHHMDFAPTFLEAAGLRPPESFTGRSLLPLFRQSDPARDAVVTGFERHTMCRPGGITYPMRSLRTSRYLYIRNFEPSRWPTGGEFLSSNLATHGDVDACPSKSFILDPANRQRYPRQYNLCFGRRPAEELYDLQSDPWQVNNVATNRAHAAARKSLRARLEQYLTSTGDPRIANQDPWKDYVYYQTNGYGASFNRSLPEADRAKARALGAHKPE
jgi:uncharacterized sulfatase